MGLFTKKKALPELPKPDIPASSMASDIKLPDFPSSDFPAYESLSSDFSNIKRAVKQPPALNRFEEPRPEPRPSQSPPTTMGEKTLFIKIDDYETAMAAIERLKEKVKNMEVVINNLEKLKRQEDTELDNWHKDIDSLKQRLMTIESRLFHM